MMFFNFNIQQVIEKSEPVCKTRKEPEKHKNIILYTTDI